MVMDWRWWVDDVISILASAFGAIDFEEKANVFTVVVVVVRPLRHPRFPSCIG
jgi:hypothetical protein